MKLFLASARAEETASEILEAVEAEPTWAQEAVEKFSETPVTLWVAILTVAALAAVFLKAGKSHKKWNARTIAYAALAIALSFVLSCIRLFRMPTGGSVTPGSMLPLMLFSVSFGMGPGLLAGLVYGLLQYLQGGWWLNIWQFLLDYLLAFAAIGLAGIAHKRDKKWLYIGIPAAALGRAVCAVLAGMMWIADTPVSELVIGGIQFNSPLLYSIVYNGAYLIPDCAICLLLALLTAKPLLRIMKSK